MKISDLSNITEVLDTNANDNSFLILNKAADGSTAPVTYQVSLTHAGKTLANNLALVNYNAANKELKAYSINNTEYTNNVIGYYLDSTQVSKLAGITASANVADIAYDGTNKKIIKTINGTTSDVVSTATILGELTVDSSPTANSTHPVSSGGVAAAISGFYTKPNGGIPSTDLADTYLTSFTETDPTVPSWAKASTKPIYSISEMTDVAAPTFTTSITIGSTTLTEAQLQALIALIPSSESEPEE